MSGELRSTASSPPIASSSGDLLLACLRYSLCAEETSKLIETARSFHDWSGFLALADFHSLGPLAAGSLDSAGVDVPDEVRASLDKALRQNAKHVLILSTELNRILRRFEAAGIPALTVKGPVSAWTLYEDPAYRMFSDLDLLVLPSCLTDARQILVECGYQPSGSPEINVAREAALFRMTEMIYENARSGIHVDLHWSLTPKNWFVSMAPGFWERTRTVSVGGCTGATLGEEDTFLHLCFHGAKHGWTNLNWLVDICGLIRRSPGIGRRCLQLVKPDSKAAGMVHFALVASGIIAPGIRQESVGVPARIEALARSTIQGALRGELTDTVLARCRFQWSLGGSRLVMSRYIFHWLLTPDQTDWASLPLQNPNLLFLLTPWRLIRLTRRAVSGAVRL